MQQHLAMEEESSSSTTRRRRELGEKIVEKVGGVITSIRDSKHVDQVICSLHSLAVLLFPLDSLSLSGSIDQKYRDQVLSAKVPSKDARNDWWQVFYQGATFPTLARILLCDVASNWLACFPFAARKHVYDVFFVNGRATDVVQTVVPFLQQSGTTGSIDTTAVYRNAERLLVHCLLDNDGVLHITREFGGSSQSQDFENGQLKPDISSVAQLVTSIPDKARLGAPKSLSSHFFFKQITVQLLAGVEEWDMNLCDKAAIYNGDVIDDTILFVGESFARICRRGSADVLLSEVVPRILRQLRSFALSSTDLTTIGLVFESKPGSRFWSKMMEAIKDTYAVGRISEQLLHQLAAEHASDVEAYWVLWILFHRLCERQTTIRSTFVEIFLLWKVFPVCCLRWILQFTVLQCPPDADVAKESSNRALIDTILRLVTVWSKREFVQSASMEQQAYITAALGLSLEKMSKEDLDATKDAMHLILQGVSCRLESPAHLVRRMAGTIALVFSKVIDPKNPLYLDDSFTGETIDWEFGLATAEKGILASSSSSEKDGAKLKGSTSLLTEKEFMDNDGMRTEVKGRKKKPSEFKMVDPDEIVDPATLNELVSDEEDDEDDDRSEDSETSSDSSLRPYDLADDDTDLKRKFSQLADVVGALRKSDDPDGVERALDVVEKLVRSSPDELVYTAGDLIRTLVQVRCFDSTIEGEEESAEEKRQKALGALIVISPLPSLDSLNKLLYSPNIDVSQRIMILDVMTRAALELADTRTIKPKHQPRPIISTVSETQPWFVPSSVGPPGAGSWKEISRTDTPLNWSYSYERELPVKSDQIRRGKTRRWSHRAANLRENPMEWSENEFPRYAAAFMLPSMQGFDKKRHGVDLLGRDFIVLGKLIYMLGVCMKCAAMHPEASALALPLMDMLSSREICHHVEAYVRRAVLFAASCILVALHPSYVASALAEGNLGISKGLEWIRTWALNVAESDTDRECYTMATTCLQLHAEMALQASRALESTESPIRVKSIGLPSNRSPFLKGTIKIPFSNLGY